MLGLAVALARTARSPWLAPVRVAAVVYTDLFRGIPTILLILLLGFGVPALQLQGLTERRLLLGRRSRWCSPTAPTSPRCSAPASTRSTPRRSPARTALGLSRGRRRCGTSSCPQAVRRVVPPAAQRLRLAAEGHRAGRRRSASSTRCSRRATTRRYNFNYTPYVVVAVLLRRADGAAGAVHRLAARRRWMRAGAGGRAAESTPLLEVDRPAQDLRRPGGPRRHRPRPSSRTTWSA